MMIHYFKNGSINNKVYSFSDRKWDLTTKTTIDINNLFLNDIQISLRNNNKKAKIRPLYNHEEGRASVSDETRFSINTRETTQLIGTVIRHTSEQYKSKKVNWPKMLMLFKNNISLLRHKSLLAIIEKEIDLETRIAIKDLFSQFSNHTIVLDSNSSFMLSEKNVFLKKSLNKVISYNLSLVNKLREVYNKTYLTSYNSFSINYILGIKNNCLNNLYSKLILITTESSPKGMPANMYFVTKSFFESSGTYTNLQGVVKKSSLCIKGGHSHVKSSLHTSIYMYSI